MSMTTDKAKQALKDNLNYLKPQKDPVMWNNTNALLNLSDAIAELQREADEIKRAMSKA